jgi:GNAT superfamily N-acetyltransferase
LKRKDRDERKEEEGREKHGDRIPLPDRRGLPELRGAEEGGQAKRDEGVLIARASVASLFEFTYLYLQSFESDGFNVPVPVLQGTLHEVAHLMSKGQAEVWGAWWKPYVVGPPMGMVEVRLAWGAPFGRHYQVARLYVREEYRGKAVARALLADALLSLPDADAPVLFMVAKESLPRSYKRLGARTFGVLGVGRLADAQAILRRE